MANDDNQLEINSEVMNVPAEIDSSQFPNHTDEKLKRRIENDFRYHAPKPGQPEIYTALREKAREFAHFINQVVPNGREKSEALTNLETCVYFANGGIARNSEDI
jgi:hypothetical protein